MNISRFPEFKRFLSIYKVDEYIFHRACNNFEYLLLKESESLNIKEKENKDFFIILNGKIRAYYERDLRQMSDFENNFIKKRILIKVNTIEKENKIEMNLNSGDFFGEKIKYKGFSLKSIEAIGDNVDLIYLNENIYEKIFSFSISKFEKQKRNFILKNISPLCDLSNRRFENFLRNTDTIVL
jgi:hypothetical protein